MMLSLLSYAACTSLKSFLMSENISTDVSARKTDFWILVQPLRSRYLLTSRLTLLSSISYITKNSILFGVFFIRSVNPNIFFIRCSIFSISLYSWCLFSEHIFCCLQFLHFVVFYLLNDTYWRFFFLGIMLYVFGNKRFNNFCHEFVHFLVCSCSWWLYNREPVLTKKQIDFSLFKAYLEAQFFP